MCALISGFKTLRAAPCFYQRCATKLKLALRPARGLLTRKMNRPSSGNKASAREMYLELATRDEPPEDDGSGPQDVAQQQGGLDQSSEVRLPPNLLRRHTSLDLTSPHKELLKTGFRPNPTSTDTDDYYNVNDAADGAEDIEAPTWFEHQFWEVLSKNKKANMPVYCLLCLAPVVGAIGPLIEFLFGCGTLSPTIEALFEVGMFCFSLLWVLLFRGLLHVVRGAHGNIARFADDEKEEETAQMVLNFDADAIARIQDEGHPDFVSPKMRARIFGNVHDHHTSKKEQRSQRKRSNGLPTFADVEEGGGTLQQSASAKQRDSTKHLDAFGVDMINDNKGVQEELEKARYETTEEEIEQTYYHQYLVRTNSQKPNPTLPDDLETGGIRTRTQSVIQTFYSKSKESREYNWYGGERTQCPTRIVRTAVLCLAKPRVVPFDRCRQQIHTRP